MFGINYLTFKVTGLLCPSFPFYTSFIGLLLVIVFGINYLTFKVYFVHHSPFIHHRLTSCHCVWNKLVRLTLSIIPLLYFYHSPSFPFYTSIIGLLVIVFGINYLTFKVTGLLCPSFPFYISIIGLLLVIVFGINYLTFKVTGLLCPSFPFYISIIGLLLVIVFGINYLTFKVTGHYFVHVHHSPFIFLS